MAASVTLTVTRGPLKGQAFVFSEPGTCVLGRSGDCAPRLPDDDQHRTISRHHCLVDLNPPDVRVRDFGSRNGTWVNGVKIGQREPGETPEDAAGRQFPEHDLGQGDEIRLGDTVLQVGVDAPALCAECEAELPEQEAGTGVRCATCAQKTTQAQRVARSALAPKQCVACDVVVTGETGRRPGAVVCQACREDPDRVVNRLTTLQQGAFDRYEVTGLLGRGGMGAVYLARDQDTGEQVALKVMLPQIAARRQATELFARETAAVTTLHHPNIVGVRDSGCWNGIFYFVMEHCDGGNLEAWARRQPRRPQVETAVGFVCQALEGLDYAHTVPAPVILADGRKERARGLVHRDVSPHNILLAGDTAKLGDFGLAKAFDVAGLSGLTRTGAAGGKAWFMPRQQVVNYRHAKPEVDVWAAAACLYYLLTRQPPRDFPVGMDDWRVVLESPAVPIRERARWVPKRLAFVIDQALVDRPTIGIASAAELRTALRNAL